MRAVAEAVESVDCPDTERLATVVVASVEVPVTARDPVVVALTLVRLVILPLVIDALVAERLVVVALVPAQAARWPPTRTAQ